MNVTLRYLFEHRRADLMLFDRGLDQDHPMLIKDTFNLELSELVYRDFDNSLVRGVVLCVNYLGVFPLEMLIK